MIICGMDLPSSVDDNVGHSVDGGKIKDDN